VTVSFEQRTLRSREQRALQKAAIEAIGGTLKKAWRQEPLEPTPDHITRWLAELDRSHQQD